MPQNDETSQKCGVYKAIAVGQRFDDERGFACSGDKVGFLLSMPSLRLMFQFIKIHKTAEVPHCQDEYGAIAEIR